MSAKLLNAAAQMWERKAIEWFALAHTYEMNNDHGNARDALWFACYCEEQAKHLIGQVET